MSVLPKSYHRQRRSQCQPTPVLLPGKCHGQRTLVGGSPWGHEESDMTERLHFSLFHFITRKTTKMSVMVKDNCLPSTESGMVGTGGACGRHENACPL